jgi:hypothetical protein
VLLPEKASALVDHAWQSIPEKCSDSNGGNLACPAGAAVWAVVSAMMSALDAGSPTVPRPYSPNSNNSAISNEKMPSASVMAKPKIRLPN